MLPGLLIQQQVLSKHGDFGPRAPIAHRNGAIWLPTTTKYFLIDKKGGGREIPQTQVIETHTSEEIQADVGAGIKWSYWDERIGPNELTLHWISSEAGRLNAWASPQAGCACQHRTLREQRLQIKP